MPERAVPTLITFTVLAYNQEAFIRESIEGAFSQTYSPLEIILSDDCSSDRTFAIMQDMAANYIGPHTIILNHNETNQGIGSHVNRVLKISTGELIVMSAGDDISLPERTQRSYEAWEESGREAYSIFTNMYIIDESSIIKRLCHKTSPMITQSIDEAFLHFGCGVSGCSQTIHRKIFCNFSDILPTIIAEDIILPFRALLLGKQIKYLNQPLVKYRSFGQGISSNLFSMLNSVSDTIKQLKRDAMIVGISLSEEVAQQHLINNEMLLEAINTIDHGNSFAGILAVLKLSLHFGKPMLLRYYIKKQITKKCFHIIK